MTGKTIAIALFVAAGLTPLAQAQQDEQPPVAVTPM